MRRLLVLSVVTCVIGVTSYGVILPELGRAELSAIESTIVGNAKRGAYIATAAGCYACHTDTKNNGEPFAGGRSFKTRFGTVYSSNITSDRETGIGGWTLSDFKTALTSGVSPKREHYFPVFPYTSYTHLRDQDVADLKSYFDAVTPVSNLNRVPDMRWPYSDRTFVGVWKWLYAPQRSRDELTEVAGQVPRGAYLIEVLGHCGECHTQRNALGGYTGKSLGGNTNGPDDGKVPGIRNLSGAWSANEIASYLADGMTPEGDFVGGEMSDVIDYSTSKLTDADRLAIANHLLQLGK